MKKFYEEAELEIVTLGSKDIIATSGDEEIELPDFDFGD